MKTAVVFADWKKQVIFTPENDNERMALALITPDDNIELAIKRWSFVNESEVANFMIGTCTWGYLRMYGDKDSVMLVLSPKKTENEKHS